MQEGGLGAPTRHPIVWEDPEFTDPDLIDAELRRVFDICHGCRRCFNLCDSFPRLFDLIDESDSGELDTVDSKDFKPVVDACTLCDMCFMVKCPYVPPHEFDLDFPHLMLRYRAMEFKQGKTPFVHRQICQTDRNAKIAGPVAGLVNWATKTGNALTRRLMEIIAGIHRDADLPAYRRPTLVEEKTHPQVNKDAPGHGRKVAVFATCFANYNAPSIGAAALEVLALNGVETEIVYPGCCGMPQLEGGDLKAVADQARTISAAFKQWIAKGYGVVALVPSCALMMKFEWPLILPDDENVKALAKATFDITEYVVGISRKEGLAPGMSPLPGGVSLHLACHARAQNMGPMGAEMLRLIPDTEIAVIERCSGHGGSWGIFTENFPIALKVGKPVARSAKKNEKAHLASECPLAGAHVVQGMEKLEENGAEVSPSRHPIELMALAYGWNGD
ncbi:MAG: glycerol-3-phosphate dehydrogenase [Rhodospirillaceae bacterium]|jgi:glycerol-3-phosphate dehydrogenase subunit C|nr:glycerol-3-phosphate dehydrogenase [Rhodospirillaceae bacterium]MBT5374012.1 glycerol-3-phosphate dehydrogenase [Rhodospirillaceae bacterium]MBT5659592.1 glycerol-3-phosphate dehydrogenase [Rhodospirillaceae bacterium]MBT5751158.1 glycerol-3-phosphate dehydrogenase [Rhodospirillaceae bacterium]